MKEGLDFSEREKFLREEEWVQSLKDLANELMGVPNAPREYRFLFDEQLEYLDPRKKAEKEQERSFSRLLLLLRSNAAYAKLYYETFEQLIDAETQAELAIDHYDKIQKQALLDLETTLDRAATLPNGTRVFKDKNNQVWTEHGELVEGQALKEIVWHKDQPSREEFLAKQKAFYEADNKLKEWQAYRVDVLGYIRERMSDKHDPAQEHEIKQFQRDMRERRPEAKVFSNTEVLNAEVSRSSTETLIPKDIKIISLNN